MFVQIGGINYMHQVHVSTLMLEGGIHAPDAW